MPPRDPTKVQLDFPILVAELIDQLQLLGSVGLLDFNPSVQPVFLIGSRGIVFSSQTPEYGSSEVFSARLNNPLGGTVVVDTGPLTGGTYDIVAEMILEGNGTIGQFWPFEHRNAANTATLATLLSLPVTNIVRIRNTRLPMIGYVIGDNERLRMVAAPTSADIMFSGTIFATLRPTP